MVNERVVKKMGQCVEVVGATTEVEVEMVDKAGHATTRYDTIMA